MPIRSAGKFEIDPPEGLFVWRLNNNGVMACVQLASCFPRRWGTWHGPETPSGADLYCTFIVCQLGGSKNHLLQGLVYLGRLGTLFSAPKQNMLRSLLCA